MRNPSQRLADLRAQRAANLTGERRLARARRAPRRSSRSAAGMSEILDYAERRTRARSRSFPTAATRPRTSWRTTPGERPDDIRLRVAARIEGDAADARLHGHRLAGGGQPQLPPLGDEVGGVLRGSRPDGPRRPAVGGRLSPDRGDRARGVPAECPARRPPSPPETWRRRAAWPTWCSTRCRRPRQRPRRARGR